MANGIDHLRSGVISAGRTAITAFTGGIVALCLTAACSSPTETAGTMRPQSVVMLVTPKILQDFANPEDAIANFFAHYAPLTSRASEVVLVFAVGSGDHILNYRGQNYWSDRIDWARTTDLKPVSDRPIDYFILDHIVAAFKKAASGSRFKFKIFDLIDSGGEFTVTSSFKYVLHPECTINRWGMFDVRGRLQADKSIYASAPEGIVEGMLCGDFLADQVAKYMADFAFDGILFGNQLGTRGRWIDGDGPGYSAEEAAGITEFLKYSKSVFQSRNLMWSDSYNNVKVEHDTFSFPSDGYQYFDYLVASGFCVITKTRQHQYLDDLDSKLSIINRSRVLASLDYVDPWYSYRSMTDYPACSAELEDIAVSHRFRVDGIWFSANDETGSLIPANVIESFAARFFAQ